MVVTLFADEANVIRAFEAGASGYLMKDGSQDDLAEHVRQLHAGGSPVSPMIARQMLRRWQQVRPDGGPPTRDAAWPLARRWDRQYPGRGGTARFEVDLDAPADRRPAALLFYRIGNQAVVRLNGQLLQQWGEPGRPEVDVAKQARWIELPADRLRPGPNRLVIELGIQAQRWGGLASFDYGPRELLAERLAANRFWRGQITQVFAIGLGLMGALAAALWWRQRDPLFGCFALGAGLGIVRHADRLIETAPLPWPLWGGVVAASYAPGPWRCSCWCPARWPRSAGWAGRPGAANGSAACCWRSARWRCWPACTT
ncbi:hypothetical protein ABXN37_16965 [Piscinibacter sakaiensis]|uniref:hypothetical protein n=1 Tax=Piscinibacter sakaiensis TaxID=1547922 RepID=UPI00372BD21D